MKKNLSQISQIIESETKVNHKSVGRNNSTSQVSNAVLIESGENSDLIAAEKVSKNSDENSEKESEKKDVFRAAVTESFNELISKDNEYIRLSSELENRRRALLVDALESNVSSLWPELDNDTICSLVVYGREFTNGWLNSSCTNVAENVRVFRSESVSRGESSRTAFSVFEDGSKFYPVTIVSHFRQFVDVARVVGLPCYAPFAAIDARNKSAENANKSLSAALAAGVDFSALVDSLPADVLAAIAAAAAAKK